MVQIDHKPCVVNFLDHGTTYLNAAITRLIEGHLTSVSFTSNNVEALIIKHCLDYGLRVALRNNYYETEDGTTLRNITHRITQ